MLVIAYSLLLAIASRLQLEELRVIYNVVALLLYDVVVGLAVVAAKYIMLIAALRIGVVPKLFARVAEHKLNALQIYDLDLIEISIFLGLFQADCLPIRLLFQVECHMNHGIVPPREIVYLYHTR